MYWLKTDQDYKNETSLLKDTFINLEKKSIYLNHYLLDLFFSSFFWNKFIAISLLVVLASGTIKLWLSNSFTLGKQTRDLKLKNTGLLSSINYGKEIWFTVAFVKYNTLI